MWPIAVGAACAFGVTSLLAYKIRSNTIKTSNKHWSVCRGCPLVKRCPTAKNNKGVGPEEFALRASLAVQSGIGISFLFISFILLGDLFAGWLFTVFRFLLVGGLACTFYAVLKPNDHDFYLFLGGCAPWIFLFVLQLLGVAMGWPSPFGA